jgi:hypothetical protein
LLAANENNEADGENTDIASFAHALSLCDDVAISDAETAALVFLAGYDGFKVQRKISCDMCKAELLCDNTLHYDISKTNFAYLAEIDRGGLRWPTDFLLEVVTQVFVVFQALTSKDYENKFLTVSNQRSLLRILSTERLIECGVVVGECSCGVLKRQRTLYAREVIRKQKFFIRRQKLAYSDNRWLGNRSLNFLINLKLRCMRVFQASI